MIQSTGTKEGLKIAENRQKRTRADQSDKTDAEDEPRPQKQTHCKRLCTSSLG